MVPIGPVIAIVIVVLIVVFFPLIFQFLIIQMCSGRILAVILTKGKDLEFKLLKKIGGEFVEDQGDQWILDPTMQRLVPYPILFGPLGKLLKFFQQIVPCSIYMRGRQDPLDWENPAIASLMSSKELAAILDPHWLVALVKGVEQGVAGAGAIPKNMKMMLFLAVGASVLAVVLSLVLLYKDSQSSMVMQQILDGLNKLPK
jgi:hypothetical protein